MSSYLDKDWQLRIFYNTTPTGFQVMEHIARYWIKVRAATAPGDGFDTVDVDLKGGAVTTLDLALTTFLAALLPRHSTVTEFSRAELWAADAGTDDFVFWAIEAIGDTGTVASTAVVAQQETFTFRSSDGRSGRVQVMEGMAGGNGRNAYPYTGSALTLADYVTGASSVITTRSSAFFIASINLLEGQNEELFEKRFRA